MSSFLGVWKSQHFLSGLDKPRRLRSLAELVVTELYRTHVTHVLLDCTAKLPSRSRLWDRQKHMGNVDLNGTELPEQLLMRSISCPIEQVSIFELLNPSRNLRICRNLSKSRSRALVNIHRHGLGFPHENGLNGFQLNGLQTVRSPFGVAGPSVLSRPVTRF